MKTRVAIMLISPGKAGVESVLHNLFRHFSSNRVEIWLISSAEIAPYFRDVVPAERHFITGTWFNTPSQRHLRYLHRYLDHKFDRTAKKLRKWSLKIYHFLKENEIGTIHANLVWDYYMASEIKRLNPGILYINTMHGTLALDPSDTYFPFFERPDILRMLSNVDVFTSACHYFIDLMNLWNIPVRDAAIIPNGIDPEVYPAATERSGEEITLCFMGGGRPDQKGGDILMHALYLLIHKHGINRFKVLIYGQVPENGRERELAAQLKLGTYIDWRGFVEPPGHLSGMAEADIFLLPSRHEGVANTLMEAIGAGIAIVATRKGGTPEVIQDGENGLLCYPDATDLAEKLSRLMKDKGLRESMAQSNRTLSRQYFWKDLVKQYEAVYLAKNSLRDIPETVKS